MDIFSHALWGGIAFGWRKRFAYAVLFGLLPDLIPFFPFFIYRLSQGTFVWGRPALESFPSWVFPVYNTTHSLFFAVLLLFLIRSFSKNLAFSFLAWPFHILMDIPTHTKEFFPTKFLFPLSKFFIDGFDWASPRFLLTNYSLLFLALGFFIYLKSKEQQKG